MPKFLPSTLHRHIPCICAQAYRHPQTKSRHAVRAVQGAICHGALTTCIPGTLGRLGLPLHAQAAQWRRGPLRCVSVQPPARQVARQPGRRRGEALGYREEQQQAAGEERRASIRHHGRGTGSSRRRAVSARGRTRHACAAFAACVVCRVAPPNPTTLPLRTRKYKVRSLMQSALPAIVAGLVLLCMHHSASSTVFSMAAGTHWALAVHRPVRPGGPPSALRLRGGGDAAKAAGEPGHTAGAAGPCLRCNAQRAHPHAGGLGRLQAQLNTNTRRLPLHALLAFPRGSRVRCTLQFTHAQGAGIFG
jgi:hypothetical protein